MALSRGWRRQSDQESSEECRPRPLRHERANRTLDRDRRSREAREAEELGAPHDFVEERVEEGEDERVERAGRAGHGLTRIEREALPRGDISRHLGVDPRIVQGKAPASRDPVLGFEVERGRRARDDDE